MCRTALKFLRLKDTFFKSCLSFVINVLCPIIHNSYLYTSIFRCFEGASDDGIPRNKYRIFRVEMPCYFERNLRNFKTKGFMVNHNICDIFKVNKYTLYEYKEQCFSHKLIMITSMKLY
jgi:hypothetical protein